MGRAALGPPKECGGIYRWVETMRSGPGRVTASVSSGVMFTMSQALPGAVFMGKKSYWGSLCKWGMLIVPTSQGM